MYVKKSLGQHFLFSVPLINNIIDAAGSIDGINVLEIGPGKGNMTREILKRKPGRLIAVEYDHNLMSCLADIQQSPEVSLLFDNALYIKEEELLSRPAKVIANLPYNISVALIVKWLELGNLFESITVMMQKEVAYRICATPRTKSYGMLSILCQISSDIVHNLDVPPEAFTPQPKVHSSVITLYPKNKKMLFKLNVLKRISQVLFSRRRKQLSSAFDLLFSSPQEVCVRLKINPNSRPEELSVEQFCQLSLEVLRDDIPS